MSAVPADQSDPLQQFIGALRDAGPQPEEAPVAAAASSADAARAAEDALLKEMQRKTKITEVVTKAKKADAEAVLQEQKAREEQYKSFARAVKVSAEAEAAAAAIEDTPEKRFDALRKYGLLREMGLPGTRARLSADSPLEKILAEIGVMDSQLNLERAVGMPEQIVTGSIRSAEYAALPFGIDIRGTADDFEALLEDSRKSADPIDRHLDRAMLQLSIKYSSYFAMGPEMYIGTLLLRLGRSRMARNERARAERDVSDQLAAKLADFDDDDVGGEQ